MDLFEKVVKSNYEFYIRCQRRIFIRVALSISIVCNASGDFRKLGNIASKFLAPPTPNPPSNMKTGAPNDGLLIQSFIRHLHQQPLRIAGCFGLGCANPAATQ